MLTAKHVFRVFCDAVTSQGSFDDDFMEALFFTLNRKSKEAAMIQVEVKFWKWNGTKRQWD